MDESIFDVDTAEDENADELYHHGVRGQAWGVQNGPPYPLGSAGKSAFSRMKAMLGSNGRGRLLATRAANQAALNKKIVAAKIRGRTANTADIKNMVQNAKAKNQLSKARHEGKLSKEQYKTEKEKLRAERALYKADRKKAEGRGQKLSAKEELKQRIINSGDPRLLNKYGKYLNAEEYKQASDRVLARYDLANARVQKINERGQLIAGKLQNAAGITKGAMDNYSNIRQILVSINPNLATRMPDIGKPKSAREMLEETQAAAKLSMMKASPAQFNAAKSAKDIKGNDIQYGYKWAADQLSKKVNKSDLENYIKTANADELREINKILSNMSNP